MYGCVYCFLNPGIFQYSFGKRSKIRWLKVQYSIRLPLSCQTTDLIWNWKVLKRLKNQGFRS
jgi:hypothetical protein